jgi:hypothetical protein
MSLCRECKVKSCPRDAEARQECQRKISSLNIMMDKIAEIRRVHNQ